jgi:hypothetical protein
MELTRSTDRGRKSPRVRGGSEELAHEIRQLPGLMHHRALVECLRRAIPGSARDRTWTLAPYIKGNSRVDEGK